MNKSGKFQGPVKVLVVDDEEAIRRNFRAGLEDLGYEVMVSADGMGGIDLLSRQPADIVLSDLRMARMDGFSFLAKMREISPDTPVIIVSGSGALEDAIMAIRMGAWDYIVKPVRNPKELDDAIQRALERARLTDESRQKLKNLENQILRMQRVESIGRLTNGIAHDLNNLLSPILMAAELLSKNQELAKGLNYFQLILGSAQRAADLIKQLLLFSRGLEPVRKELQLRDLLGEVARILRETFPKHIDLKFLIPEKLPTVEADATQIHQVIMNLCVNARDAMPAGGRLEIELSQVEQDETDLITRSHNIKARSFVVIKVSDTGSGIAPEILPKIFDPFFSTKPVGQGSGLGLSTALGIVRNHDGFMDVKSAMEKGTQFLVYLPVKESGKTAEASSLRMDEEKAAGEMILIVDDERAILFLMQDILESAGYKVICASNGMEALKAYSEKGDTVKLVIMDMSMPSMAGQTAIMELQARNPDVRIIATSGLPLDQEAREKHHVIKAFLQKPVPRRLLLTTVRRILKESS